MWWWFFIFQAALNQNPGLMIYILRFKVTSIWSKVSIFRIQVKPGFNLKICISFDLQRMKSLLSASPCRFPLENKSSLLCFSFCLHWPPNLAVLSKTLAPIGDQCLLIAIIFCWHAAHVRYYSNQSMNVDLSSKHSPGGCKWNYCFTLASLRAVVGLCRSVCYVTYG